MDRVDRRCNDQGIALREDRDIANSERVQRGYRPPPRRPEADYRGAELTAVLAGSSYLLESMQDRAVARQLVVLVEDVGAKAPLGGPVVHCFPCDQRQPAVYCELSDCLVLDAVRPAPQDLPPMELGEVLLHRLGLKYHVALLDQLRA